jgi:hypothetical protein
MATVVSSSAPVTASTDPLNVFSKRIMNAIRAMNNQAMTQFSPTADKVPILDLDKWVIELFNFLDEHNTGANGLLDLTIGTGTDPINLATIKDAFNKRPKKKLLPADKGVLVDKRTILRLFRDNNSSERDNELHNANVIDIIGDGSCLIHAILYALSKLYRSLDEKYQAVVGLFFRRYVYAPYAQRCDELSAYEKEIAGLLFADEFSSREDMLKSLSGVPSAPSISESNYNYLTGDSIRCLANLLCINVLSFNTSGAANHMVYTISDPDNKANCGNPRIVVLYSNGIHYNAVSILNARRKPIFLMTDDWVQKNFPTSYGAKSYYNSSNYADRLLFSASTILKRDIPANELLRKVRFLFGSPSKTPPSPKLSSKPPTKVSSDVVDQVTQAEMEAIKEQLLGYLQKILEKIYENTSKIPLALGTGNSTMDCNTNDPAQVSEKTIVIGANGEVLETERGCPAADMPDET